MFGNGKIESEFLTEKKKSVIDYIEDAKTAKFALFLIYGILTGKSSASASLFPLDEFNDDSMNAILRLIIEELEEKEVCND